MDTERMVSLKNMATLARLEQKFWQTQKNHPFAYAAMIKAEALEEAYAAVQPVQPTHRHRKRGTSYHKVGLGLVQTDAPLNDMDSVVVYVGHEGHIWVRNADEFNDERFETLPVDKDAVTLDLTKRFGYKRHATFKEQASDELRERINEFFRSMSKGSIQRPPTVEDIGPRLCSYLET